MIGTKVGRWNITEEIGDGGHAFVFKGECDGEVAAIKMLKPSVANEPDLERRFQREVEALGLLKHEGIVGFKEYLHIGGYHYLVLEYMDAGTTDHILRNVGALEVRYALPIIDQLLGGIALAHSKGYIHRDIKPNNILLNKAGQAKIADFGIAKLVGGENMTRPGFVLGTTQYMAPEYLSQGDVSVQTDIYSLGVLLYEMVTGRRPFEFKDPDEPLVSFAKRVCMGTPAPPSAYRPIPDALEKIILKSIAQEPKKRYKDVDRFRADLRKAFPDLVNRPIVIPEGRPMTEQLAIPRVVTPPAQKRPQFVLLPAILLGVGLAMGAGAFLVASKDAIRIGGAVLGGAIAALGIFLGLRKPAPVVVSASASVSDSGGPAPEVKEGPMPFHGGSEDTSYAASDTSELRAFLVELEGGEKSQRFGLRPVSRIGRDLRFDIRPNDPEISRHHAAITFTGSEFEICDLGSMNGTFVNERRLKEPERVPLKHGDIVRVGRTELRFEQAA